MLFLKQKIYYLKEFCSIVMNKYSIVDKMTKLQKIVILCQNPNILVTERDGVSNGLLNTIVCKCSCCIIWKLDSYVLCVNSRWEDLMLLGKSDCPFF